MAPDTLWQDIRAKHEHLAQELSSPTLDNSKRHIYQKEFSQLTTLLEKKNTLERIEHELKETELQAASTTDLELAQLFQEEITTYQMRLKIAQRELDDLMYPPDEHDNRNVYLEIRAGTGGQEAALFAADLMKMYTNYALKKGWKVSIESTSTTDLGGLREAVLYIKGKQAYGHLKFESGVHRVQRVPQTETQGRIHTSTATVAVLPEADEVEITINPADLRIDVYRSGGAGGQHVNTTDSAVRITHIPTGVVVACQDERSQHKNKDKALKMLKSRILAAQVEQKEAELAKARKEQVGGGMRAEKVRTYNFPQNRVTDHQVDVTLQKLDMVMQGDLDDIVEPLMKKAADLRRKQPLSFIKS